MSQNKDPTLGYRRRMILFLSIFAVMASGILYLTWKDIYAEIPTYDELQVAKANEFRPDIGRDPISRGGRYSIEFKDDSGNRYQTPRMSRDELDQIIHALTQNISVMVRYGKWRSSFPSSTISTIYQVELPNHVVIPYERLANAGHREQDAGRLIILSTILVAGIAIFIAVRRDIRFRKELLLLQHPPQGANNKGCYEPYNRRDSKPK